ncbi:MAG: lipopolysaccharide biosynthesis protein [Austwickia sp.]|nr:lipopolysaccharide biosynthesis protein [Actinomycetota bacterium]MCO5310793.1 lipopolysaccharide biosynthesis protein [Austwickia sp.]
MRAVRARRRPVATSPPPLHGSLLGSAVLALSAAGAGAAVNFALVVVVGRSYGPADTGLFFAVIGVVLVLANLLKLGADTGLTRFASRARATGREADLPTLATAALLPVLGVGALAALALAALGGGIGELLDGRHAATAAALLRQVAPVLPLLALTTVLTAGTRGLGRVGAFALVQNVVLPGTRLVGVAAAAALGLGVAGAITGWAAGLPLVALLAAVLFAATLRRVLRAAPARRPATGRAALWREFWAFSLPRAAAALVEIVLEWLDVLLVAVLAGERAAGLYAVATRLVKVSLLVDNALRVSISTRISAWLATGRIEAVQRLYEAATAAMIALVWPALLVLAVFAEVAVGLFGADFAAAAPVLRVMCLGVAAFAAAGSLQSILLLGGGSARQLLNKSAALATCVGANLLLTPHWGALGAALAWLLTVLVDTVLVAWAVRRRMGIAVSLRPVVAMGPLVIGCVGTAALAARWLLGPTLGGLTVALVVGLGSLLLALRGGDRLELITRRLRDTT